MDINYQSRTEVVGLDNWCEASDSDMESCDWPVLQNSKELRDRDTKEMQRNEATSESGLLDTVPRASNPTAKAARQSKTCRFFALPPELRNMIYEAVLVAPEPRVFGVPDIDSDKSDRVLLHVCKQTRNEATPIYYSRNRFNPLRVLSQETLRSHYSQVRLIRTLQMRGYFQRPGPKLAIECIEILFEITSDDKNIRFEVVGGSTGYCISVHPYFRDISEDAVRRFCAKEVEERLRRPGKLSLDGYDLFEVLCKLHTCLHLGR